MEGVEGTSVDSNPGTAALEILDEKAHIRPALRKTLAEPVEESLAPLAVGLDVEILEFTEYLEFVRKEVDRRPVKQNLAVALVETTRRGADRLLPLRRDDYVMDLLAGLVGNAAAQGRNNKVEDRGGIRLVARLLGIPVDIVEERRQKHLGSRLLGKRQLSDKAADIVEMLERVEIPVGQFWQQPAFYP